MQELTLDFQSKEFGGDSPAKETPMMKQYREVKEQVGDAILFFRLGDFYEIFGEDARLAAPVLGVTLTARHKGENAMPMCGIPFHAADSYIQKLLKAGYKVAICEQVSDPSLPGLVERKLMRVITPATQFFDSVLDEKSATFLLALHREKEQWSLVFADISTGDFFAYEGGSFEEFQARVSLYPYQEILMSEAFVQFVHSSHEQAKDFSGFLNRWKGLNTQRKIPFHAEGLLETSFPGWLHQEAKSFSALTSDLLAMVLDYLHFTQQGKIVHAKRPELPSNYKLWMDHISYRNLEIFEANQSNGQSLYQVLAHCKTGMGLRNLRQWMANPLRELALIEARRDALSFFYERADLSRDIEAFLLQMGDLERLVAKLASSYAGPKDIQRLLFSLLLIRDLQALDFEGSPLCEKIKNLFTDFECWEQSLASFEDLIPAKWRDGSFLKDTAHEQLAFYRNNRRYAEQSLQKIEREERLATGIESLKVVYSRVFGYMIEVNKVHLAKVPTHYLRKQTLANAERFICEALTVHETQVLEAQEQALLLEKQLFESMQAKLLESKALIQKNAEVLAELDVLVTWASFSRKNRYICPSPSPEACRDLHLRGLRHPVLEQVMEQGSFIPNDVDFKESELEMMVLTGPNMSGKSTYLRQLALAVYLYHIGMYVPADEAEIPLFDALFTRIGASDNLAEGSSTFMVEMQETATILHRSTAKSLLILDEVGRGTSTYDGLSLAWAIVEHLARKTRAFAVFATHYHELIDWAEQTPYVENFSIRVDKRGEEVLFMHHLQKGAISQSFGLEVARLAGLPSDILENAKSILHQLELKAKRDFNYSFEKGLRALNMNELSPKEAWDTLYQIQNEISS